MEIKFFKSRPRHRGGSAVVEQRAQQFGDDDLRVAPGGYPPKAPVSGEPTFLSAAVSYMEAGRPARYVAALIRYFGETKLSAIDQAAIDRAAVAIKPNGTPVNRNAAVYSPVSAILHFAGVEMVVHRPKGFRGRARTDWLSPPDAFGIITAADGFDFEFATLLCFLLYTGPRISAALELRREDLQLDEARAWARNQKGQPHMQVRLQSELCARLKALAAHHDRDRMFRWHYGAQLCHLLLRAKLSYLGLPCPVRRPVGWIEPPNRLEWVTFHVWRHTWATWMRQAGTDVKGLVATGNWRDERSASRYAPCPVPRRN